MLSKLPKTSANLSKLPPVATRTPGMAQERGRTRLAITYYTLTTPDDRRRSLGTGSPPADQPI